MKPVPTPTPSEKVVASAAQSVEVVDSLGRRILVKRPLLSDQLDVMVVVGPEASKNDMYMAMMNVLLHVKSIDDDPVLPLTSKKAIDEMVNKLGNEGVEAVTTAISENFAKTFTVDEVKKKSTS